MECLSVNKSTVWRIAGLTRQGLAVMLSGLMLLIPMGQGDIFAQTAPPPTFPGLQDAEQPVYEPPYQSAPIPPPSAPQAPPQAKLLPAGQLDQLVAPIALYPDQLLAPVLAASTYPTEVVVANRWLTAQGSAPPAQIAAGVNNQPWDPSVKALTAFPQVLAQMDRNLQWTTDLGNAYYNQPQDVMNAVQTMRQRALSAGQLRSTPQQNVSTVDGLITIGPADPSLVYVPAYDPWAVWGSPLPPYPDYDYYPPADAFYGGLLVGFGIGIGIGFWGGWGWGWGHWGCGWHNHAVYFNNSRFFTHSTTVLNRGLNRPGGPGPGFASRGAFAHPAAGSGSGHPATVAGGPSSGGTSHGAFGGHSSGSGFSGGHSSGSGFSGGHSGGGGFGGGHAGGGGFGGGGFGGGGFGGGGFGGGGHGR